MPKQTSMPTDKAFGPLPLLVRLQEIRVRCLSKQDSVPDSRFIFYVRRRPSPLGAMEDGGSAIV